jgi:ferritin-like metal-binding protein YciE
MKGVDVAEINDPRQLFQHKLGAALTMERTVLEMLEKNEQEAQDSTLKQQFAHHREETEGQIRNLEQAFSALGIDPQTQPCPAIDGLKTEGEQLISQTSGRLVDAVLVGGAAETEHHEIAVYEGLITKAEAMGEQDIVALLQENLEQEQHTLKEVQAAGQQLAQQLASQTA